MSNNNLPDLPTNLQNLSVVNLSEMKEWRNGNTNTKEIETSILRQQVRRAAARSIDLEEEEAEAVRVAAAARKPRTTKNNTTKSGTTSSRDPQSSSRRETRSTPPRNTNHTKQSRSSPALNNYNSNTISSATSPSGERDRDRDSNGNSNSNSNSNRRPSLPDNRLTVTNFQELQRHQPATLTQKRVNQKQLKKKHRAMREQHNQAEKAASFLSRVLSWMWKNRSYGVVTWFVYYLWRADGKLLQRARRLQQKAMEEGIDALTSELSSTATIYATKTASEGTNFFGKRPRTTGALVVILTYQITKFLTLYRSTSKRDPKDRMSKYPASIEQKLIKRIPEEEEEEEKEDEKAKAEIRRGREQGGGGGGER